MKLPFSNYFELDDKPAWIIICRGAALPGLIVAACGSIGLLYGLLTHGKIIGTFRVGIGIGLFFTLLGALDIIVAILFGDEGKIRTKILFILGFILTWTICVGIIIYSFD